MIKKLLSILLLIVSVFSGLSQTTTTNYITVATDYFRPRFGGMNWNDDYVVPAPPGAATGVFGGIDRYERFNWTQIQNDAGVFDWTTFDNRIGIAIAHGQKFSFSFMSYCEGCNSTQSPNGVPLTYPLFLHTAMQADAIKDFKAADQWIPYWNGATYLNAWKALLMAVSNHINSTTINGVALKNVVYYVDIRGYGNFGEFHNYPYTQQAPTYPANFTPTVATIDSLVAYHMEAFPNFKAVNMIEIFNASGDSNIPLAATWYALTAKNNVGGTGWRRDNWGDATNYLAILDNNPGSFNGLTFKTAIMGAWVLGPITGEPLNGLNNYADIAVELTKYHGSSFGNGNFGGDGNLTNNILNAVKTAGARPQFLSSTMTTTLHPGQPWTLTLPWNNLGITPAAYDGWIAQIELRNVAGTTVFQTWNSSLNMRTFMPGVNSITDNFTLNNTVPIGTYNLYLIIRDSTGFSKPYPLNQTAQLADGSYLLRGNISVAAATSPVTANAGSNFTVTVPQTATLNGTASTGVITSVLWTKISGPGTTTITNNTALTATASGLQVGTYVFQLSLNGGVSTSTVTVTVLAHQAPTVSAGNPQTITISSATTTGQVTFFQGAVTQSIVWTQVSGPSTATITQPGSLTTSFTALVTGTYVFRLTVTDNAGGIGTATVNIVVTISVHAPPVVNAGPLQTIFQPVSSAIENGSVTYSDGAIAQSILWVQVSGPRTVSFSNPTGLGTTILGMTAAGTYLFKLTVTDNLGGVGSSPTLVIIKRKFIFRFFNTFAKEIPRTP